MNTITDADRARCEAAGWYAKGRDESSWFTCDSVAETNHKPTGALWVLEADRSRQSCTSCLLKHLDAQAPQRETFFAIGHDAAEAQSIDLWKVLSNTRREPGPDPPVRWGWGDIGRIVGVSVNAKGLSVDVEFDRPAPAPVDQLAINVEIYRDYKGQGPALRGARILRRPAEEGPLHHIGAEKRGPKLGTIAAVHDDGTVTIETGASKKIREDREKQSLRLWRRYQRRQFEWVRCGHIGTELCIHHRRVIQAHANACRFDGIEQNEATIELLQATSDGKRKPKTAERLSQARGWDGRFTL